jgi:hypothetical protein
MEPYKPDEIAIKQKFHEGLRTSIKDNVETILARDEWEPEELKLEKLLRFALAQERVESRNKPKTQQRRRETTSNTGGGGQRGRRIYSDVKVTAELIQRIRQENGADADHQYSLDRMRKTPKEGAEKEAYLAFARENSMCYSCRVKNKFSEHKDNKCPYFPPRQQVPPSSYEPKNASTDRPSSDHQPEDEKEAAVLAEVEFVEDREGSSDNKAPDVIIEILEKEQKINAIRLEDMAQQPVLQVDVATQSHQDESDVETLPDLEDSDDSDDESTEEIVTADTRRLDTEESKVELVSPDLTEDSDYDSRTDEDSNSDSDDDSSDSESDMEEEEPSSHHYASAATTQLKDRRWERELSKSEDEAEISEQQLANILNNILSKAFSKEDYGNYSLNEKYAKALKEQIGWSEIEVDLFATKDNTKALKYFAREGGERDENCVGEDAFKYSWSHFHSAWINPPFHRIPEVIKKIESDKVEIAVLIAPVTSTLKDKLEKLSVRDPILLPRTSDTFIPKGKVEGVGPTPWEQTAAYVISGKNKKRYEKKKYDQYQKLRTAEAKGETAAAVDDNVAENRANNLKRWIFRGQTNNVLVDVLRDTGSTMNLVRKSLVEENKWKTRKTEKPIRIKYADGVNGQEIKE